MWEYEHSVWTAASPGAVWRQWSDMAAWPRWNDGVEAVSVDGPFEAGTRFTMTPPGEEPIAMRLTEVVPGEVFTDEMDGGDFVVTTVHRLVPSDGGTTIVYRTEITGDVPDGLGPAITADFPDVLARLAAIA
jgi:uncharacterized protein YndB with AHSA1/START domain